jgi:hypothetical protein
LSAEFPTSRSEARHQRITGKQSLLDSYPHNLPSSVNIFIILEAQGNNEILEIALQLSTQAITNKVTL